VEELDLVLHYHYSLLYIDYSEASALFPSSRGLRRGDPLSLRLFILLMKTRNKMVIKSVEEGTLDGFLISNPRSEGLLISHLLFADDTLTFCKLNESNLGYLRCILLLFEAMSGLRVDLSKSALRLLRSLM